MVSPTARPYIVSAVFSGLLIAVPFFTVTFPPVTDLPQQTAQIRLLGEALSGSDAYRVQWFHPNKLGYLPLAMAWWVAGPLAAGRLGLLAIGMLWVAAIHALARFRGRPPSMAVMATLFFFSHPTYWGFLNFLVGFPAFVAWYLVVAKLDDRVGWRDGALLVVTSFLLYCAHVLWLAVACVWLVVATRLDRRSVTEVLRRVAWLVPVLIAVAAWYGSVFTTSGVDERTFWGRPPWVRLSPAFMLPAMFGGLRGWTEAVVALCVAGWCGLGWLTHARQRDASWDRRLALLGLALFAASLVLPEVHRHTIYFAVRWTPVAALFLALASPAPRLRPVLRMAGPALLLVTLVTSTSAAWMGFEQEELEGFEESLDALAPGGTLLGLDLVRASPRIHVLAYYHLFAYGQVLRGGELNRSFADEASSLVVFRELPWTYPWTDRLEWRPERLRQSDRDHFDYILVHAEDDGHAFFLRDPHLEPVTPPRRWRLYRVSP